MLSVSISNKSFGQTKGNKIAAAIQYINRTGNGGGGGRCFRTFILIGGGGLLQDPFHAHHCLQLFRSWAGDVGTGSDSLHSCLWRKPFLWCRGDNSWSPSAPFSHLTWSAQDSRLYLIYYIHYFFYFFSALMKLLFWLLHPDPRSRATIKDLQKDKWTNQTLDTAQLTFDTVFGK